MQTIREQREKILMQWQCFKVKELLENCEKFVQPSLVYLNTQIFASVAFLCIAMLFWSFGVLSVPEFENTHLSNLGIWIGVFFVFDLLIGYFFIAENEEDNTTKIVPPSARWFLLHVIGNFFVIIFSLQDTINIILWPDVHLQWGTPSSMQCIYAAVALHIYHVLGYFKHLKREDWIHHIVSAFFVGFFAMCVPWGPIKSFHCFFITGLPGGIDYFLIVLVKAKKMDALTEKHINTILNVWIRSVGLLFSTAYIHLFIDRNAAHLAYPLALKLFNLLNVWNAQHFMEIVVASFVKHSTLKQISNAPF